MAVSVDKSLGRTWLSGGISRLDGHQMRLGGALGGGGSTSLFLDLEARRQLGNGWSVSVASRRG